MVLCLSAQDIEQKNLPVEHREHFQLAYTAHTHTQTAPGITFKSSICRLPIKLLLTNAIFKYYKYYTLHQQATNPLNRPDHIQYNTGEPVLQCNSTEPVSNSISHLCLY